MLQVKACHHVPLTVNVVCVIQQAVSVLRQAFATHEIRQFYHSACGVGGIHSKLSELVIGSEFSVISVAIGVVNSRIVCPMIRRTPLHRSDIMVLIEVIGGTIPQRTIVHAIAEGLEIAVGVLRKLL